MLNSKCNVDVDKPRGEKVKRILERKYGYSIYLFFYSIPPPYPPSYPFCPVTLTSSSFFNSANTSFLIPTPTPFFFFDFFHIFLISWFLPCVSSSTSMNDDRHALFYPLWTQLHGGRMLVWSWGWVVVVALIFWVSSLKTVPLNQHQS
jgi:hypothetical protein